MSDIIKGLLKYVLPIILLFVTVKYLLHSQTDPDYKVTNVISEFVNFIEALGEQDFFWANLNEFVQNTFIPLGEYIEGGNVGEQILGVLGIIGSILYIPFMLLYDVVVGIFTIVGKIFTFITYP